MRRVLRGKGLTAALGFGLLLMMEAGCTSHGTYRLHLIFAGDAPRESVNQVELFAIERGKNTCGEWMEGQLSLDAVNIYSRLVVELPEEGEQRLTRVPARALLFLAEGRDGHGPNGAPILRGCTAAAVRSGATVVVTVELRWYCIPVAGGEILGNGVDDDCDGLTDECGEDLQCDDDNVCTLDLCENGVCHQTLYPAGLPCQDMDRCTRKDACAEGACRGEAKDCRVYSGQCRVGECEQGTGACVAQPVADGLLCDGGLYCTVAEACRSGYCTGAPRDCEDGDDCSADSCDEAQNRCGHERRPRPGMERPSGTPSCANGLDDDCDGLTDGDDPNCKPCAGDQECNDDNPCTTDVCEAGVCKNRPVVDGALCDDGRYCTFGDGCHEGVCLGAPRNCDSLSNACGVGVCAEDRDVCIAEPKANGTFCDDGLFCTLADKCQGGVCLGRVNDCDDDSFCTTERCNETDDHCEYTYTARPGWEGVQTPGSCTNLVDDDCNGLTDAADPNCVPCGSDAECADQNTCTADRCTAGYCENTPLDDGAACDDGEPCTLGDGCETGVCAAGSGRKDSDGDQYVDMQCPGGDDCDDGRLDVNPGVSEGPFGDASCTDGLDNDCDTLTDAQDTACLQCTNDPECDDRNVCTSDRCGGVRCENAPLPGTVCDDRLYCTGADSCDGSGRCGAHVGDPCLATDQRCDEANQRCVDCLADADCGDGLLCTDDRCLTGTGTCLNTADHTICGEDGLYCNGTERCDPSSPVHNPASGCVPSPAPCAGGAECNRVCNEAQDTCFDAAGTACGDGTSTGCTAPDTCDGGGNCLSNHSSPGAACDDSWFCNGWDTCDSGGGCTVHSGDPCLPQGCDEDGDACLGGSKALVLLATGGTHTCGLTADGRAYCWGQDDLGQLGNGGIAGNQPRPSPVDTTTISGSQAFLQLTAMGSHTCGLMADRTAYCWGNDGSGQLGNGAAGSTQSPSAVDTTPITGNDAFLQLATGLDHTCGLLADGVGYCWGNDANGQLGNGTVSGNQQSPSAVNTSPMTGNRAFLQLTAGEYHSCGLAADGVAYCWGDDRDGQLGDGGTSANAESPSVVDTLPITGNTAFVQLTGGNYHTCGLTADGVAYCWGGDFSGQLGDGGTSVNTQSPAVVDTSPITGNTAFVQLTGGNNHTCGLMADGVAYCWGGDQAAQLGNGAAGGSQSPSAVETAPMVGNRAFVRIAAGDSHTCGIAADGVTHCWGSNSFGQLGNGKGPGNEQSPSTVDTNPVSASKAFVQLASGYNGTCGLTAEGTVYCWGRDANGELGNGGTSVDTQIPSQVDTSTITGNRAFVQLTAGTNHTCGRMADGEVYCWGQDSSGQLGNGSNSGNQQSPSLVDTSTVTGNKAFAQVGATGGWHTCGVMVDGAAYCWGDDTSGGLGDGGNSVSTQSPSPVDTTRINDNRAFVYVRAGGYHSCGLAADGKAYCWGQDSSGQLGDGGNSTDTQRPSAVDTRTILGNNAFARLTGGAWHNCVVAADGQAYCWGADAFGDLGNGGTSVNSQRPSAVDTNPLAGNKTFVQLALGQWHTCGLAANGVAYCWGYDANGALGNGIGPGDQQSPFPVDTTPISSGAIVTQLAAGDWHSCALTADGLAYCWGDDTNGGLGNGPISGDQQSPCAVDLSGL